MTQIPSQYAFVGQVREGMIQRNSNVQLNLQQRNNLGWRPYQVLRTRNAPPRRSVSTIVG